jgi:RNA polymerase sigma-70 factor (ECF subfamily)
MSAKVSTFWVTLMTVTSKDINFRAQSATQDFETIFVEHWSRVYGVIFRLVGDKAEAEDLALETFWRLYRNPPSQRENLGGWLYRVAVNLGLNALRARKRRTHYEEEAGSLAFDIHQPYEPENEVERAERRREVQAVLVRMKPRSAKLLVLRHSGLSYKELAAVIKVKPSSVGKLLARAEDEFERSYHQLLGE